MHSAQVEAGLADKALGCACAWLVQLTGQSAAPSNGHSATLSTPKYRPCLTPLLFKLNVWVTLLHPILKKMK